MKTCCGMNGAPNYPAGCAAVCVAGTCASDEEVRATVETATSSRFHMSESILLLIHYPSPFFFSEGRAVRNFSGGCEGRNPRGLLQRKFLQVLQPCRFPLLGCPRFLLPRRILRQRRGGTCYYPSLRNLISRQTSSTVLSFKVEEFDELLEAMEDSLIKVCITSQSCSVLQCSKFVNNHLQLNNLLLRQICFPKAE